MTTVLKIQNAEGKRDFAGSDFPVAITLTEGGEIGFGGATAPAPVAWLGFEQDRLFIQPETGANIELNGLLLKQSGWLTVDDEIKIAASAFTVSADNGVPLIAPAGQTVGTQSVPLKPLSPPAVEMPPITPLPIQSTHTRWRRLLLALFMLLVLCVVFVLAAAPVESAETPTWAVWRPRLHAPASVFLNRPS